MKIEVFGPGCAKCMETERLVREVLAEMDVAAEVVKISDRTAIQEAGIIMTPAIAVNGKIKSMGKIPAKSQIKTWITEEM